MKNDFERFEQPNAGLLRCGIDLGSTTAKVVVVAQPAGPGTSATILFSAYRRHDARIRETLQLILREALQQVGNARVAVCVTGSAGMGLCERLDLPFVQEVVAAAEVVRTQYPQVGTLLDIGGEDSKLILFDDRGRIDMRMNGSCAGGTGAFIDQMAVLLGVGVSDIEDLARQHQRIVPIASRCGVFAKTDVQNLLSRSVPKADIAASVLQAVALQTVNALARATTPRAKLLMSGGPLTFLPSLRQAAVERFGFTTDDVVQAEHAELFSALGAALSPEGDDHAVLLGGLVERLCTDVVDLTLASNREAPLFRDAAHLEQWQSTRFKGIDRASLQSLHGKPCFLGIDSGSTTTKMVLIDQQGRIALENYAFNHGDPVGAVQRGLRQLAQQLEDAGSTPRIVASAATGYGEDLVRNVFGLDLGLVETIAHLRAAREVAPDVSFVLDIGGQDMKAMYIDQGEIASIEINEACSSGCGSFLQTFAEVLGMSVAEFAAQACDSAAPCKLGSRCTVFMNSRVKQFLREGAPVGDIAAGLAYSVIRNCLEKVLRIHDMDVMGPTIVVQGGTFLNPAIQRAFELLSGKKVVCPDIAGVIGAWGAALVAMDHFGLGQLPRAGAATGLDLRAAAEVGLCTKNDFVCQGCENLCHITRLRFGGKRTYFSGNRCERIQSNRGKQVPHGVNLAKRREELVFAPSAAPEPKPAGARRKIGLPRALNLFESLPFWRVLLSELGFDVELSSPSTVRLYNKGIGTIMSDSLCLPAKMVHGHVLDLVERKVDAVFYPQVVYELPEGKALASFNCPIVTGYPEVIRSSIDPKRSYGIDLHAPVLTFANKELLAKGVWSAVKALGGPKLKKAEFARALDAGLDELARVRKAQQSEGEQLVRAAKAAGRRVILLAGRPYHLDRYINHGIPEMLSELGVDVITTEMVPTDGPLDGLQVLTQWAFPNRLYHAVRYAALHDHIEVVQINSFGCGPDAMASDEMAAILKQAGKKLTVVRVDETASPGSIRLRLRTLIETLAIRGLRAPTPQVRLAPPPFTEADRDRLLLGPSWFPMLDKFTEDAFADQGYRLKILPPPSEESRALGLKYVNNEVCYPAILVAGDMLLALQSGQYGDRVAVAISQTGGQCRASCYASLLGKALISAGYTDVPVVTLHMDDAGLHHQPGFVLDRLRFAGRGIFSILVADVLAMLERTMLPRELEKGAASRLAKHFVDKWLETSERSHRRALALLGEAARAFAAIPARTDPIPKIGMVGEIYVKYCDYGNGGVVKWLADRGVETVVPNVTTFFIQSVINLQADTEMGLAPLDVKWLASHLLDDQTDRLIKRINKVLEVYPYAVPLSRPRELAESARPIVALSNQYGEGWLLTGEMVELAQRGADNILCVQPFGCIANQVVAKGIEKRLRELHPTINVLFIDMDHNVSEANLFNRLHFLVRGAEESLKAAAHTPLPADLHTHPSKRAAAKRSLAAVLHHLGDPLGQSPLAKVLETTSLGLAWRQKKPPTGPLA
ncbi:MAG: 2-hydroxyacyl-CoA dehydratase [Deltaproteobacteria bacterium]|nr:2-hydroxyacyl-CoA dehydratase [Deltaproteobacteria bacterium]